LRFPDGDFWLRHLVGKVTFELEQGGVCW
jgi:hypothetical protein